MMEKAALEKEMQSMKNRLKTAMAELKATKQSLDQDDQP